MLVPVVIWSIGNPWFGVNSDLTTFSTAPYCYHKSTENSFSCNSIPPVWIALQSCACHEICAIVSYTKSSDDCLIIWFRVKLNFHGIWNAVKKILSEMVSRSFEACHLRQTATPSMFGRPEAWGDSAKYRQVSNIRRTKSQHLKDPRTVLRLSLPNPLKPNVKSRMKM